MSISGSDRIMDIKKELGQLRSKIAIQKRKLTRCKSFISDFEKNPQGLETLLKCKDRLNEIYEDYDRLQDEVELLTPEATSDKDRLHVERDYYSALDRIHALVRSFAVEMHATTSPSPRSIPTRLPNMELPKFGGDITHWNSFKELFLSILNQQEGLSDVQKLQYLKVSLVGSASNLISTLELTAENYKLAWEILTTRYNNPRVLAHTVIRSLIDYPRLNKETPEGIRMLIDHFQNCLRTLKSISIKVDTWDAILVYHLTSKLDNNSVRKFEEHQHSSQIPAYLDLVDFLESHAQALAASLRDPVRSLDSKLCNLTLNKSKRKIGNTFTTQAKFTIKCPYCQGEHRLYKCSQFQELSCDKRNDFVKENGLCTNCFNKGHLKGSCKSSYSCLKCRKNHHTLLHRESKPPPVENSIAHSQAVVSSQLPHASLATAYVKVGTSKNHVNCRALLDSGSTHSLVTEKIIKTLKLKTKKTSVTIKGVCGTATNIVSSVKLNLQDTNSLNFSKEIFCLVVPEISSSIPAIPVNLETDKLPSPCPLADRYYQKASEVGILIGSETFWDILVQNSIKLQVENDVQIRLQETKLGFVIISSVPHLEGEALNSHIMCEERDLNTSIQKFWELENVQSKEGNALSESENFAEDLYASTTFRDKEGKYVVRMPFRGTPEFSKTRNPALRRLHSIHTKLKNDPELFSEYSNFMETYETMGHMKKLTHNTYIDGDSVNYIPHHFVIKEESSTTRLRVVFDGSARVGDRPSLNEQLHVGPCVQNDLFDILLRFRTYPVAITADIEKFYRQIWIAPDQRDSLRILWSTNNNSKINTYQLKTVTYGLACSAYLSCRTLIQLVKDEGETFPLASQALLSGCYVDDLVTGARDDESALRMQRETTSLLKLGGFPIRKWASNSDNVLRQIPEELRLPMDEDPLLKTKNSKILGLIWNRANDTFSFDINNKPVRTWTKRLVASRICSIFDPLGFLSPVTLTAKSFLQKLWILGLNWDDSVDEEFCSQWNKFYSALTALTNISINRYMFDTQTTYEIHIFADASPIGYGAACYIVQHNTSQLFIAKSRITQPDKHTIPRLELCAAVLAIDLLNKVKISFENIEQERIFLWSDSTIVLYWIKARGALKDVFVKNRIEKILRHSEINSWNYVPTHLNPADLITRHLDPARLPGNEFWFHGPDFVLSPRPLWPQFPALKHTTTSEVTSSAAHSYHSPSGACLATKQEVNKAVEGNWIRNLLMRTNNYFKILRIISYVLKFVNLKIHKQSTEYYVTSYELLKAENILLRHMQRESFAEEAKTLKSDAELKPTSSLFKLNAFMHTDGLIRVGTRLEATCVPWEQAHPIILCSHHIVTKLIIVHLHNKYFHLANQSLLYHLRLKYWPIKGLRTIRTALRGCLNCISARKKTYTQRMSSLPPERLQPSRPFSYTGMDYFGPLRVRKCKAVYSEDDKAKVYVLLFICMVTRAIHLELVLNQSLETFMCALRRFIARRGTPHTMYSDNAPTFIHANKLLQEAHSRREILEFSEGRGITWKFTPPFSPHFGGSWERFVRIVKWQINLTIKKHTLTFEKLNTLLVDIEGIINSRPLSPLSTDPDDLLPLTPAHFLIGSPLNSLPYLNKIPYGTRLDTIYQKIESMRREFWARWTGEYINNLQLRNKWQQDESLVSIGDLVMLKQEAYPPFVWPLGRVTNTFPGTDGRVRVVELKTAKGILKRPIVKIAPLLSKEDLEVKCVPSRGGEYVTDPGQKCV